jgi:hypothetical protein
MNRWPGQKVPNEVPEMPNEAPEMPRTHRTRAFIRPKLP